MSEWMNKFMNEWINHILVIWRLCFVDFWSLRWVMFVNPLSATRVKIFHGKFHRLLVLDTLGWQELHNQTNPCTRERPNINWFKKTKIFIKNGWHLKGFKCFPENDAFTFREDLWYSFLVVWGKDRIWQPTRQALYRPTCCWTHLPIPTTWQPNPK